MNLLRRSLTQIRMLFRAEGSQDCEDRIDRADHILQQVLGASIPICETFRLDLWSWNGRRWPSIHARNRTICSLILRQRRLSSGLQIELCDGPNSRCWVGVSEELLYVSLSYIMIDMAIRELTGLSYSKILRMDRERTRSQNGYERDGGQGQERGTATWTY
jgi:hypothetical protein